jgi:hypothetical protein
MMMIIGQWTMVAWCAGSLRPAASLGRARADPQGAAEVVELIGQ